MLNQLKRPDGITCPKYERVGEGKRCRHFVKGGSCALPDELLCVEWVKVNPDKAQGYDQTPLPGVEPPSPKPKPAPKPRPSQPVPPRPLDASGLADPILHPEHVDALASRDLEAHLVSDTVDVWLVPTYTDQRDTRNEMTYRDAASLANIVAAFPEGQIVAIKKRP